MTQQEENRRRRERTRSDVQAQKIGPQIEQRSSCLDISCVLQVVKVNGLFADWLVNPLVRWHRSMLLSSVHYVG